MVDAMTSYAEDRARYDTTYIRDVYERVEAASSRFKLPSNTTWPGVATALGDIRACLSIDANTTWTLDAAPFDCAAIPVCDITCGGPSV